MVVSQNQDCRVYVGNLDGLTTWQRLKDHMGSAGKVVRADLFEGPSGKSKGCGLVEFESPEVAQVAIQTLTDSELDGRKIFVREDRENSYDYRPAGRGGRRMEYGRGGGNSNGYSSGRGGENFARRGPQGGPSSLSTPNKGRQIFVSNLAWSVDWIALKDHFRAAGEVQFADVYHLADGRSKGCGIVTFSRREDAETAVEKFDNTMFLGRPMSVRIDEGRPRRENDVAMV